METNFTSNAEIRIFLFEANQFQYYLQSPVAILYETHVEQKQTGHNGNGQWAMGKKETKKLRRTECILHVRKYIVNISSVCRAQCVGSIRRIRSLRLQNT